MLKFRGTWRITGLLLFTMCRRISGSVSVGSIQCPPASKASHSANHREGGRVSIAGAGQIPIENVNGWAQTNDGWMVPTFLLRWWHRHLGLGEV